MNDLDFKKKRKLLGLTQEELAEKLHVNRRTIINYEKGGTIPPAQVQLLDILIAEQAKGTENAKPLDIREPVELHTNKNGNVFYEKGDKLYMSVKLVPVKAFGSYLSDFQDSEFYERLEDREFRVDHKGRGNYVCFEVEGDSMNGGHINDAPAGSELLCRELGKHHWKDGFRDSTYGWVIIHKSTVLYKDITDFNPETGDITCHSRSGLPQHPDFVINLDDVRQIFKVIKRQF